MKKILLLALISPAFVFAQVKVNKTPKAQKVVAQNTGGFIINGDVTGLADGTKISLLNGQTGAPEQQAGVYKNKFTFTGKLDKPAFKIIIVDQKPPYLTLFLDNSTVAVTGSKEALDRASVSGSVSHNDFVKLNSQLMPYQAYFSENAPAPDETQLNAAKQVISEFIRQNPKSYIAPLAVVRFTQLSDDVMKADELFQSLDPVVRTTDIGNYIAQTIEDNKRNGVGTVLSDFTQPDTSGTPFSLSSLRGKYVLIDFWASWCRPCRQENPNVVANFQKFKDRNFTVLGVSLDKAKPAWLEAIGQDGLTWSHVSDLQGWANSVAQQFKIQSIPQNFLIDPQGKVIAKNLRGPALERKLEQLLK